MEASVKGDSSSVVDEASVRSNSSSTTDNSSISESNDWYEYLLKQIDEKSPFSGSYHSFYKENTP
jgi:hypothetical protein